MENLQILDSNSIGKRGGACMAPTNKDDTYLITGGANRMTDNFKDFWLIKLQKDSTGKVVTGKKKLEEVETPIGCQGLTSISSNTGDVFIFGGQNTMHQRHNNDFYRFKSNNNILVKIVDASGDIPPARSSHAMVYHPSSNSIYLFGGANNTGPLKDFYCYSIDDNSWKKITSPSDDRFTAREMLTMEIWNEDSVLLVGGRNAQSFQKSIILYNVKTGEWDLDFKKIPGALCSHASILLGDHLYLFGGVGEGMLEDKIVRLDLVQKNSVKARLSEFEVEASENNPETLGLMAACVEYSQKFDCFVLFGGSKIMDELERVLII